MKGEGRGLRRGIVGDWGGGILEKMETPIKNSVSKVYEFNDRVKGKEN